MYKDETVKKKRKNMAESRSDDIDRLLRHDHSAQVAALKRLMRSGYFGNLRAYSGGVLSRIIGDWNRLPPSQSNRKQLDEIAIRMKAAADGIENKEFLNELIRMNHFGDLKRVKHQQLWKTDLARHGVMPEYEDWSGTINTSICSLCRDTTFRMCSLCKTPLCGNPCLGKHKCQK